MRAYGWHGIGTPRAYTIRPGMLIALDYRAWRVTDIRDAGDAGDITHVVRAYLDADGPDSPHYEITLKRWQALDALPEHYSVCVRCGDVQPCREQIAEKTAAAEAKRATRFEVAGVCPACLQPVTSRQRSVTFDENVVAPLGPPVTFHLRKRCELDAVEYEKRWSKATGQPLRLSCGGTLMQHRDGTRECLDLDCPDVAARHYDLTSCWLRSHGCPRFECTYGPLTGATS